MLQHEETVTIQMRAKPRQRELIDRAALLLGKNRSEFIMETSIREAKNVLLDQTVFYLDDTVWDELTSILNAPSKRNPKLEKLMSKKSPWEE